MLRYLVDMIGHESDVRTCLWGGQEHLSDSFLQMLDSLCVYLYEIYLQGELYIRKLFILGTLSVAIQILRMFNKLSDLKLLKK